MVIATIVSGEHWDVAARTAAFMRGCPDARALFLTAAGQHIAPYKHALTHVAVDGDWVELPGRPGLRLWKALARVRSARPAMTFIPVLPGRQGLGSARILAAALLLGRPIQVGCTLEPNDQGSVSSRMTRGRCVCILLASLAEVAIQALGGWMLFGLLRLARLGRRSAAADSPHRAGRRSNG